MAGQVIGSTHQQIKRLAKQEESKTQKAVGDVKEVVKEAVKEVKNDVAPKSERPLAPAAKPHSGSGIGGGGNQWP